MNKKEQILSDLKEAELSGMTKKEIFKKYGHSNKTVNDYISKYNLKIFNSKCGRKKVYTGEFESFCNVHTMKEIIEHYGIGAKHVVYKNRIKHQKELPKHNAKAYDIINDLKEHRLNQTQIAKKYNVSRQYVSLLKINEEL